ncbi:MAG: thioredoxin family protein [Phycisphaerales bacterium]
MARTPSTMAELGTPANHFNLTDTVSGQTVSLSTFAGKKGLLIMFMCNHCPFVVHVKDQLAKLGQDYKDADLGIVAISSNDAEKYPEDSPEKMKAFAAANGFAFPYLFDDDQSVAKMYKASCTPDFFLYDESRLLAYRGQLDSSRPGNDEPNDGADLRAAIDAVLRGEQPSAEQMPSIGCNIKWKPGNEPEYFG